MQSLKVKVSAIATLNIAKDKWKAFISTRTFSWNKCEELLKETDLKTIIRPIENQIKTIFANGRIFYQLEMINRDKFIEVMQKGTSIEYHMRKYISDYVSAFKAQFYQLFNGEETPLERISDDAKAAIRSSGEGFAEHNYKLLRILVDGANSVGSGKADIGVLDI